jgi:hypothetical protein
MHATGSATGLNIRVHSAIKNSIVEDVYKLEMEKDGSGNSFIGEDQITSGKEHKDYLAYYVVAGHKVNADYTPGLILPGYYPYKLCGKIFEAEARADRVVLVDGANEFYIRNQAQVRRSTSLKKLLASEQHKNLLVIELSPVTDNQQQQILAQLVPDVKALNYKRALVLFVLPTGWMVLRDIRRER